MKPLGTNNAVENGLTTPKNAFGKPISQCRLSTKSLKPHGIYNTRENVISASKSAFVPTNSLKQLELSSDDQRLIGVPSKQLLNFELRNMILIASFFWRLTPH
ncbi:hypothetical protein [Vibrio parahaemolyticus]|uniref:hypothetical protein n=1 Tax=Vibrio parahaemolyticus TaxID=670 RepID=UPI002A23BECD|nr:hypothetical protein [Vibrio parahaemolyticus]